MNFPFYIARRYLFAKKSHNVINIISGISAAGVAVGCAALIVVMSIFNGFNALIEAHNRDYNPDFLLEAVTGNVDYPAIQAALSDLEEIELITPVVEKNVFARAGEYNSIVEVKGVENVYPQISGMGKYVVKGKFEVAFGDIPQAVAGIGLAHNMQLRSGSVRPLELYFPNPDENISVVNPLSSLKKTSVFVSGLFSLDYNSDNSLVFIPFEEARKLMSFHDGESSSVEIFLKEGVKAEKLYDQVAKKVGPEYVVKDQYMQNAAIYKVMKSEKVAIFLILFFIIFIISCNIFGSLLMLIIEKHDDVRILASMGADEKLIKRIFLLEGWMISFLGVVAGIAVGAALALVQQHFGLLQMPGNYIVNAYPVVLKFTDVLITLLGCGVIGLVVAALPLRFIKVE